LQTHFSSLQTERAVLQSLLDLHFSVKELPDLHESPSAGVAVWQAHLSL
jgi:hypothetical protein